jgi:hypothetical protein
MNQILAIQNILADQIAKNTNITSCHLKVSDKGKILPYAIVQRGAAETTHDMNNIKDSRIEFGVKIVAGSAEDLYEAVDEISLMWNKTGINSLYQALHEHGVMRIETKYNQSGLIDTGEITGVVSLMIDIRQEYRKV